MMMRFGQIKAWEMNSCLKKQGPIIKDLNYIIPFVFHVTIDQVQSCLPSLSADKVRLYCVII